ncbi:MAG: polyphosphate polymerase domain-containing protein [Parasporobacterium sp.]|nr:polyphosphate polymerase domain-containing protein [Parasporobacterium sp.]
MAYQAVFKRFEKKFLLNKAQKEALLNVMEDYMRLDKFGHSTIRNIYFDTDDYRLIRRSIEKPNYKEKLRIRSYQKASPDSETFVEIKKKYDKIVYKRRISLPEKEAMNWILGSGECSKQCQITDEIEFFLTRYQNLKPAVFLTYEREAYYCPERKDFRITFDENILARTTNISLEEDPYGTPLLPEGMVLMELKCAGGYPMWMVRFLSENKIYKTSFSKYGTAYKTIIHPQLHRKAEEKYYFKEKSLNVINRRLPAYGRGQALRHA